MEAYLYSQKKFYYWQLQYPSEFKEKETTTIAKKYCSALILLKMWKSMDKGVNSILQLLFLNYGKVKQYLPVLKKKKKKALTQRIK